MTALTYLVEMRWETYSSYGTSENIQGEYLPTSLKIYANWKSRKYQNLSDWDLNLQISFLKLWKSEEFVGLSTEQSSGADLSSAMSRPDAISSMDSFRSISNYQSAWRKWDNWCYKREADPFVRSEKTLRFLCIFFEEEEYNYSLVDFHRTYIFVIIIPLNSTTRPCS